MDYTLQTADKIMKIIKDFISKEYKIDRNINTKLWFLKRQHGGLQLKDLKTHHCKTFINNMKRQTTVKDISCLHNSTLLVREMFLKWHKADPWNPFKLSRKEKNKIPNQFVKINEIRKEYGIEISPIQTTWQLLTIDMLQQYKSPLNKIFTILKKNNVTYLGQLFKRTKEGTLIPKEKWISKTWAKFNTRCGKGWNKLAELATT